MNLKLVRCIESAESELVSQCDHLRPRQLPAAAQLAALS